MEEIDVGPPLRKKTKKPEPIRRRNLERIYENIVRKVCRLNRCLEQVNASMPELADTIVLVRYSNVAPFAPEGGRRRLHDNARSKSSRRSAYEDNDDSEDDQGDGEDPDGAEFTPGGQVPSGARREKPLLKIACSSNQTTAATTALMSYLALQSKNAEFQTAVQEQNDVVILHNEEDADREIESRLRTRRRKRKSDDAFDESTAGAGGDGSASVEVEPMSAEHVLPLPVRIAGPKDPVAAFNAVFDRFPTGSTVFNGLASEEIVSHLPSSLSSIQHLPGRL